MKIKKFKKLTPQIYQHFFEAKHRTYWKQIYLGLAQHTCYTDITMFGFGPKGLFTPTKYYVAFFYYGCYGYTTTNQSPKA